LFYAVEPDRSWQTFDAYVNYLATSDPYQLRDRVFQTYSKLELSEESIQPRCPRKTEGDGEKLLYFTHTVLAVFG